MARVLVVEDDADLREILAYNLGRVGHGVTAVGRGREALRAAREHAPDVVLLDLMLPDMPGVDVCKALRREPGTSAARILFVTAAEPMDPAEVLELGADDCVTKPFSIGDLLLRVQAGVGR
jgi:two-component system phosphate regulon response regulator PhoB